MFLPYLQISKKLLIQVIDLYLDLHLSKDLSKREELYKKVQRVQTIDKRQQTCEKTVKGAMWC